MGGEGKCRETALPPMVMSCQAWPPWQVPSPLELACEVTFQSLAKEVGIRTRGDVERVGTSTPNPKISPEFYISSPFLLGRLVSGKRVTHYCFCLE